MLRLPKPHVICPIIVIIYRLICLSSLLHAESALESLEKFCLPLTNDSLFTFSSFRETPVCVEGDGANSCRLWSGRVVYVFVCKNYSRVL